MSDPAPQPKTGNTPGYQIFMLALCLYAIGALAVRSAIRFNESTAVILDTADYAVCAVFFIDFLWNLKRADDRWRYFITWGWIDLLSSFPMVTAARWGRLARVMRIFRVLRVLRASKRLATAIMHGRAENTALAAGLVALMSAGVALFGTLSAYLAKWFITPEVDQSSDRELAALRAEIASLRAAIEKSHR